ncbi:MAG: hypothetical protein IKO35_04425, partial [Elusimicrobiaceae bacterium]|nr:hypothetical protein [Elusimicrobiaceae bacterium]
DNYKAYLIEGKILEGLCKQKLFWSNTKNTCYMTERDRCTAHGMSMVGSGEDAFCGYKDQNGRSIKVWEGGKCVATAESGNKCLDIELHGGKCEAEEGARWACDGIFIYANSICDGTYADCDRARVYKDGVCWAEKEGSCYRGNFYDGAICEGRGPNTCGGNSAVAGESFASGSICNGRASGACGATFESGAECHGYADGSCATSHSTYRKATFQSGSTCIAHVEGACGQGPAGKAIFQAGSRCIAEVPNSCQGDYSQGGCCVADGGTCPAGTEC